MLRMVQGLPAVLLWILPLGAAAGGGDAPDAAGETVVRGQRVALEAPANTYDQLVSRLRYLPLVDLQVRNLAEAQGDVSVRGGIFENTGFVIGAVTLFDPQTGHYLAELPLAPSMTARPQVLTGVDNALSGFNSSVASLGYSLGRVRDGVLLRGGGGNGAHYHQQAYLAGTWKLPGEDQRLGLDLDLAYSAADGPRQDGDHRFFRVSGRLQVLAGGGQSDLLLAYQHKFFGWPDLYALRQLHEATGTSGAETDSLDTLLLLANHRRDYGPGSFLEATAYFRQLQDDYEFDRYQPGLYNPYEHLTRVGAVGVQGRHAWGWFALRYGAQGTWDSIESTSLVYGDFTSRGYLKLSLAPELVFAVGQSAELGVRGGMSLDLSTRDEAGVSPLGEVWFSHRLTSEGGRARYYLQVARASQLPGYTALASNPDGGLFRGNKDLRREYTLNYEAGLVLAGKRWRLQAAGFFRQDRDLVDWTVVGTFQRTAQNIDLDTAGSELVFSLRVGRIFKLVASHAFLHKLDDSGYLDPPASFYAFNYAQHRWTLALSLRPCRWFSLRADNEFRLQAPNALREGPQEAVLTTLALSLHPLPGLTLGLTVDNLFGSGFQELPGVPAALRQVLGTLKWRSR